MEFSSRSWLLVRKLVLSAACVVGSAGYVLYQPSKTPAATQVSEAPAVPAAQVRDYKGNPVDVADGTIVGRRFDARFGFVQAEVTFAGNHIVGIKTVEYPDHSPTSVEINDEALPILIHEVIAAQDANVDVISGATLTSKAWENSVKAALREAIRLART